MYSPKAQNILSTQTPIEPSSIPVKGGGLPSPKDIFFTAARYRRPARQKELTARYANTSPSPASIKILSCSGPDTHPARIQTSRTRPRSTPNQSVNRPKNTPVTSSHKMWPTRVKGRRNPNIPRPATRAALPPVSTAA